MDVQVPPSLECSEEFGASGPDYSSSEEEGECYAGPRVSNAGRRFEKLPTGRTVISQPISADEKARRQQKRIETQQVRKEKNRKIIKLTLKEAGPQLAAHKHIPGFRTEVHRHVDHLFEHEPKHREPPEVQVQQLAENPGPDPKRPRREMQINLQVDIDPKSDKTNYQTEISLQIDDAEANVRAFRAVVDTGATSSGINERLVEELGLSHKVRATSYTYRTAGGETHQALGVVRLTMRLGPISVRSWVVVMPRTCRFNFLLGNEIMTVLQGDILRSEGEVRFQYASTVVRLPLLPRERTPPSGDVLFFTQADVPDGWVEGVPPIISLPKNENRAERIGVRIGQTLNMAPF